MEIPKEPGHYFASTDGKSFNVICMVDKPLFARMRTVTVDRDKDGVIWFGEKSFSDIKRWGPKIEIPKYA